MCWVVIRYCSTHEKTLPNRPSWAEQWRQEGVEVDWERLLPPKGFSRFYHAGGWWSGGRSLLDRAQPTYELMDYERLTATSDASIIIYVCG